MTHAIVPIIRCDGANNIPNRRLWPQPCQRLVEANQAIGEDWRVLVSFIPNWDLCPPCWEAMQAIEDWRTR